MEGCTIRQVKCRYWKIMPQSYVRGPFSPEEDALLIALHQKFGRKWSKMKNYFKRSLDQLRERFSNVLSADRKMELWSFQEDKLLISMIKKYGYGQWKKISEKVPGRHDHACLLRAQRLLNWSINYHSEKGTEYDPDVYDPELFAKILRPIPSSENVRHNKHKKVQLIRETALKTLLKALQNIAPEYAAGIEDINSIDVSWMNKEMLDKLGEELYSGFPEMKNSEKKEPVPVNYLKKHPPRRKKTQFKKFMYTYNDEDDDDEEDDLQPVQKEEILEEEQELICSAMEKMLQQGGILQPALSRARNFNSKQWAEMSTYRDMLYKRFQCKTLPDEGEDDVVFDEEDYRESLLKIVPWFIQPPVEEQQFLVLAPNLTTMTGMEVVEATENRLQSMSECVSHSQNYVDYLCERRKSSPQCLQCLHRSGTFTSDPTPESVMSNMKMKSFLLDKRLETSAYVEGASVEKLNDSCVCKALEDSKSSVQLLRKRFLSLFTWPALFSAVGFSEEQERILCTARESVDYFYNMRPIELQEGFENSQKRKRRSIEEEQIAKVPKLDEALSESDS